MARLTSWCIGLGLVLSLGRGVARAESQAEIASRENEEGKELMYGGKYAEASAKFRDAVARVPEAKYFFNLCTSLYQEGKFGEGLTACDHANQNGPDEKLKGKVDKLVARIKDEAKAQGIDIQPTGGGGGNTNLPPDNGGGTQPPDNGGGTQPPDNGGGTPPNGGGTPPANPPAQVIGRPPTGPGLFATVKPQHSYTWTLGIDLFAGGGVIGGKDGSGNDIYGNAAGGFRIKSDFLLNPLLKLGIEGYLQYTHFGASGSQMLMGIPATSLDVADVGAALYKHFCVPGVERLCVTPLLGVHLALMSPNNSMDSNVITFNYAGFGARAELAAHVGLGPRYEHVFSVSVGLNAYTAALSSPDPSSGQPPASAIGLDSGGAFAYVGVGYTYRFNTPLGRAAFITLE
jgi:hypothetical protein